MPQNGQERESENTERLIGLVARLNDAILNFSVELRLSSERSERLESAIDRLQESVLEIKYHITEARGDIEKVREDQTNPKGFKLLDPADYPLRKKDDSGRVLAITDGKVKLSLPSSWVGWVLKLGVPAGLGALIHRFAQWLAANH